MQLYMPQNYMTSRFVALSASSPVSSLSVQFFVFEGGKILIYWSPQCPLPALTEVFIGKN